MMRYYVVWGDGAGVHAASLPDYQAAVTVLHALHNSGSARHGCCIWAGGQRMVGFVGLNGRTLGDEDVQHAVGELA